MEDTGYIGIRNLQVIQATVATREGKSQKIKRPNTKNEHPKIGRAREDSSSKQCEKDNTPDTLEIPPRSKLTGAKPSKMTQFYAIKPYDHEKWRKRRRTEINLRKAKTEAKRVSGIEPSEGSIWKAIRHKDISSRARYFLWITFHDAYMVGTDWQELGFAPEYQEWSECKRCHTESMEHTLTAGNLVYEKYQAQTVRRTVRQTCCSTSLFSDGSVTSPTIPDNHTLLPCHLARRPGHGHHISCAFVALALQNTGPTMAKGTPRAKACTINPFHNCFGRSGHPRGKPMQAIAVCCFKEVLSLLDGPPDHPRLDFPVNEMTSLTECEALAKPKYGPSRKYVGKTEQRMAKTNPGNHSSEVNTHPYK